MYSQAARGRKQDKMCELRSLLKGVVKNEEAHLHTTLLLSDWEGKRIILLWYQFTNQERGEWKNELGKYDCVFPSSQRKNTDDHEENEWNLLHVEKLFNSGFGWLPLASLLCSMNLQATSWGRVRWSACICTISCYAWKSNRADTIKTNRGEKRTSYYWGDW